MEQNFPQLQELYEKYCDMLYRICFLYMRNPDDAWDMVQDVFLKLIQSKPVFSDEKKEKAWLIVTASNLCKNHLKHWWRKKRSEFPEQFYKAEHEEEREVTEAIMKLPENLRLLVYLHYYEQYTLTEFHTEEKAISIPVLKLADGTMLSLVNAAFKGPGEGCEDGYFYSCEFAGIPAAETGIIVQTQITNLQYEEDPENREFTYAEDILELSALN